MGEVKKNATMSHPIVVSPCVVLGININYWIFSLDLTTILPFCLAKTLSQHLVFKCRNSIEKADQSLYNNLPTAWINQLVKVILQLDLLKQYLLSARHQAKALFKLRVLMLMPKQILNHLQTSGLWNGWPRIKSLSKQKNI